MGAEGSALPPHSGESLAPRASLTAAATDAGIAGGGFAPANSGAAGARSEEARPGEESEPGKTTASLQVTSYK